MGWKKRSYSPTYSPSFYFLLIPLLFFFFSFLFYFSLFIFFVKDISNFRRTYMKYGCGGVFVFEESMEKFEV